MLFEQDHLEKFAHSMVDEVREICKNCKDCIDHSKEHLLKFSHPSRRKLVISNLKEKNKGLDFKENAKYLHRILDKYIKEHSLKVYPQVIEFCKSLRPQHKCSEFVFERILTHGCLLSKSEQDKFKSKRNAAIIKQIRINKEFLKWLEQEYSGVKYSEIDQVIN